MRLIPFVSSPYTVIERYLPHCRDGTPASAELTCTWRND